MTPELVASAETAQPIADARWTAETLQTIEERTRAMATTVDELRRLLGLAEQAPALVAVLMDSFDEAVRHASEKGLDLERGVLNGAEAALRFGATMDAERVRDLDALLQSGVLAPATLRVVGELGRALTDTAAGPRDAVGILGLLKALGNPDVQRALAFLVTFAERFGRRLREMPPVQA